MEQDRGIAVPTAEELRSLTPAALLAAGAKLLEGDDLGTSPDLLEAALAAFRLALGTDRRGAARIGEVLALQALGRSAEAAATVGPDPSPELLAAYLPTLRQEARGDDVVRRLAACEEAVVVGVPNAELALVALLFDHRDSPEVWSWDSTRVELALLDRTDISSRLGVHADGSDDQDGPDDEVPTWVQPPARAGLVEQLLRRGLQRSGPFAQRDRASGSDAPSMSATDVLRGAAEHAVELRQYADMAPTASFWDWTVRSLAEILHDPVVQRAKAQASPAQWEETREVVFGCWDEMHLGAPFWTWRLLLSPKEALRPEGSGTDDPHELATHLTVAAINAHEFGREHAPEMLLLVARYFSKLSAFHSLADPEKASRWEDVAWRCESMAIDAGVPGVHKLRVERLVLLAEAKVGIDAEQPECLRLVGKAVEVAEEALRIGDVEPSLALIRQLYQHLLGPGVVVGDALHQVAEQLLRHAASVDAPEVQALRAMEAQLGSGLVPTADDDDVDVAVARVRDRQWEHCVTDVRRRLADLYRQDRAAEAAALALHEAERLEEEAPAAAFDILYGEARQPGWPLLDSAAGRELLRASLGVGVRALAAGQVSASRRLRSLPDQTVAAALAHAAGSLIEDAAEGELPEVARQIVELADVLTVGAGGGASASALARRDLARSVRRRAGAPGLGTAARSALDGCVERLHASSLAALVSAFEPSAEGLSEVRSQDGAEATSWLAGPRTTTQLGGVPHRLAVLDAVQQQLLGTEGVGADEALRRWSASTPSAVDVAGLEALVRTCEDIVSIRPPLDATAPDGEGERVVRARLEALRGLALAISGDAAAADAAFRAASSAAPDEMLMSARGPALAWGAVLAERGSYVSEVHAIDERRRALFAPRARSVRRQAGERPGSGGEPRVAESDGGSARGVTDRMGSALRPGGRRKGPDPRGL